MASGKITLNIVEDGVWREITEVQSYRIRGGGRMTKNELKHIIEDEYDHIVRMVSDAKTIALIDNSKSRVVALIESNTIVDTDSK